jgi:hypothetical protein
LNPGQFDFIFLLSLFRLENRVYLSRGVQVAGAAWRAATRIVVGLGDLVQRTGDGRTGQVLGAPCTCRRGAHVSWLSLKIKVDGLSWFGLKTTGTVFHRFEPQNR